MSTTEQVIAIVAKQLGRDPATITPDTDLAAAGYESLDVIETIFALEEEYKIDINFNANADSMDSFGTVADVVALVEGELAKDARA